MSITRKLHLIVFGLLIALGLLLFEFFQIASQSTADANNYLKEKTIGNLSRFLIASKEKDFVVSWNNEQKKIPLNEITMMRFRQYTGEKELIVNFPNLEKVLREELSAQVKRDPVNAKLQYDPTANRIKEFSLPQNGQRLKVEQTATKIASSLAQAQLTAPLIIEETLPEITQNSLAKLGLTALLASGESDFKGSSNGRTRNIEIGAAKFNGLLVKPGEEFSFNNNLGEVDAANDYRAELVIKSGKLIPEFGGGLCQSAITIPKDSMPLFIPG